MNQERSIFQRGEEMRKKRTLKDIRRKGLWKD